MDQHYDCRACCRDESVCSIPQCDTGLTSPGCHMDQGPEIVDEDLPSLQVPRDWQDQGPALPRPSNIPREQEIVDEDLLPPQVPRDWQDQGPALPRPSNIPVEHEIVDEDLLPPQVSGDGQDQGPEIVDDEQLSRQVSHERLTDRTRRRHIKIILPRKGGSDENPRWRGKPNYCVYSILSRL